MVYAIKYPSNSTLSFSEFKKEQELIGELMLTIASLTVRNELCLVVETAGGLQFTMELMVSGFQSLFSN